MEIVITGNYSKNRNLLKDILFITFLCLLCCSAKNKQQIFPLRPSKLYLFCLCFDGDHKKYLIHNSYTKHCNFNKSLIDQTKLTIKFTVTWLHHNQYSTAIILMHPQIFPHSKHKFSVYCKSRKLS